jgi:hypothetical protein
VFCDKQARGEVARAPTTRDRSPSAGAKGTRIMVLAAGAGLMVMSAVVAVFLGSGDPPGGVSVDDVDFQRSGLAVADEPEPFEITELPSDDPRDDAQETTAPEPTLVVPSSFGLRFQGRVRTTSGMDVKRRAKCALVAEVRDERVRRVTLRCDDAVVYDSEMPMSGISSRGSELTPRHEGLEPRFALDFYDMGQRTGRPSIRVSSPSKSVEVFDVLRPGALVVIKIDEIGELVSPSE